MSDRVPLSAAGYKRVHSQRRNASLLLVLGSQTVGPASEEQKKTFRGIRNKEQRLLSLGSWYGAWRERVA